VKKEKIMLFHDKVKFNRDKFKLIHLRSSELNRIFSKEEIQMSKKHMKKMLTISSHKGNANQNHSKIPPHPY
jgi:hypothetical protein